MPQYVVSHKRTDIYNWNGIFAVPIDHKCTGAPYHIKAPRFIIGNGIRSVPIDYKTAPMLIDT